jgi:hypothetical protein
LAGASVVVLMARAWRGDMALERRRQDAEAGAADGEPAAGETPAAGRVGPGGPGPAFPVPPLDAPHYHGVGVTMSAGASRALTGGEAPARDPSESGAAGGGPVKEVTGA